MLLQTVCTVAYCIIRQGSTVVICKSLTISLYVNLLDLFPFQMKRILQL